MGRVVLKSEPSTEGTIRPSRHNGRPSPEDRARLTEDGCSCRYRPRARRLDNFGIRDKYPARHLGLSDARGTDRRRRATGDTPSSAKPKHHGIRCAVGRGKNAFEASLGTFPSRTVRNNIDCGLVHSHVQSPGGRLRRVCAAVVFPTLGDTAQETSALDRGADP